MRYLYLTAGFVISVNAASAAFSEKKRQLFRAASRCGHAGRVLVLFPVFFCSFIGRSPRPRKRCALSRCAWLIAGLISHSGFCYFRERGECRVQGEKAKAFSSGFSLWPCWKIVSCFQPPEGILSSGADFFLLILCR